MGPETQRRRPDVMHGVGCVKAQTTLSLAPMEKSRSTEAPPHGAPDRVMCHLSETENSWRRRGAGQEQDRNMTGAGLEHDRSRTGNRTGCSLSPG
ncbi:hypothetical protein WMY93_018781 [Mugilogobius chulae]|uniref:Uncharacterized protein n=1 Tax=Mugilogobius chulae TaxID=88201 RepID=A0AAW0NV54_9GOBI